MEEFREQNESGIRAVETKEEDILTIWIKKEKKEQENRQVERETEYRVIKRRNRDFNTENNESQEKHEDIIKDKRISTPKNWGNRNISGRKKELREPISKDSKKSKILE